MAKKKKARKIMAAKKTDVQCIQVEQAEQSGFPITLSADSNGRFPNKVYWIYLFSQGAPINIPVNVFQGNPPSQLQVDANGMTETLTVDPNAKSGGRWSHSALLRRGMGILSGPGGGGIIIQN